MAFSMAPACLGCMRPKVRLRTRPFRSMPSMRSTGSSVLPLDLLIFWPSASRISPCTYTCLNGTLPVMCMVSMTMRATQKKMMSKPVTSTLEGR
ncbi:Uncharacterised protein [Bordetella pertussis]|nr:Uncharacterised protein [Bordetella pertussis]CPL79001.1 Uncharacterised protein [Bordetella pertussis]CPM37916.1 Uncharacterised protein [Bordetella pertussis]CPO81049.1 Uncharacterised protein [Bordetella pertussis]